MSRGGKPGKPTRTVAPDEAELWTRVVQSVDKVRAKPRVPSHTDELPAAPVVPPKPTPSPAKSKPKASSQAPSPPPARARAPRLAPLAEFDRRAARQVAAGKTQIDARLDLHGMRQSDARSELRAFLRAAYAKGFRTVLIITGKGGTAPEQDHLARALGEPQRGVLRRTVPQWLEEADLRPLVLSYTTAGTRHGGEGALYVQLRKPRC